LNLKRLSGPAVGATNYSNLQEHGNTKTRGFKITPAEDLSEKPRLGCAGKNYSRLQQFG
jgi:hypothetical protein